MVTVVAVMLAAFVGAAAADAPAPPPCGPPQITDAAGDGHHNTTDVLAGWFSEASGHLQAVVQVAAGNWAPDHPDSEVAGFALLFTAGGQVHYVRASAPPPSQPPIVYDYGTWTAAGGFASAGPTTGEVVAGSGGTVTIDVPAATGAVPGAVLTQLFVLTYDGVDSPTQPHWVDRAPGGVTPVGSEFGADYVVGPCGAPPPGGGGGGGALTAVTLSAPAKRTGAGPVTVSGGVAPARGGVPVDLSITTRSSTVRQLATNADGSFSVSLRLSETTRLRATAGGLSSETRTVRMLSKTRIAIRRMRGGGVRVRGRVDPALPGRVLLLRRRAVAPAARTSAKDGRFSFRLKQPRRGRYQAVFIPSKNRAKRSTSNTGVIR